MFTARYEINIEEQSRLIFIFQVGAIPQAVSRRPFTVEARVQSKASPCEICSGQSDTGTGFSGSTSFFSLLLSFHQCSTLIFTYTLLLRGQAGEAGNLLKISALSEIGEHRIKNYFQCFRL